VNYERENREPVQAMLRRSGRFTCAGHVERTLLWLVCALAVIALQWPQLAAHFWVCAALAALFFLSFTARKIAEITSVLRTLASRLEKQEERKS
jgi:hypothetical protein